MKIGVGKLGLKMLLQYGKLIHSTFISSKVIPFLSALVMVRKTPNFRTHPLVKSYANFPRRERAETHDNRREIALSQSLLASCIGYSDSAVTLLRRKSHQNQWESVFYIRIRTAEE